MVYNPYTGLHFILLRLSAPFYVSALLIGLGCGYLSVFVTGTSEHVGTKLRVTVTATLTNFMRGAVTSLIPLRILIQESFGTSVSTSLIAVGIVVWIPAIINAVVLPETYGRDLAFVG